MTLLPAIFALGDTWVHVCSSDCSNVVAYIEASVDEKFCVLTTLNIPNVDPNYSHIQLG